MSCLNYQLLLSLILTIVSLQHVQAQYIIEGNIGGLADTVLFPRSHIKAEKIKKYIKTTYYFHGNNRMSKRKQVEQTYEYSREGLLEFYSEQPLTFKARKTYGASSISIKYDAEGHAIEYHEYGDYKINSAKIGGSIYSPRINTDSGVLVRTSMIQEGDTFPYTFLIKETPNTTKVLGRRYLQGGDFFEDGYFQVVSDTGTVFYRLDEKGNIDSAHSAVYSRTYNNDSTIETCKLKGDISFGYGFQLPVNVTRWYRYTTYTWDTHKHKEILQQQIGDWYMTYYDGWDPIQQNRRRTEEAAVPFAEIEYKTGGWFNKSKYALPSRKLYFKKRYKEGFYFDVPDKLEKYTYEFYP